MFIVCIYYSCFWLISNLKFQSRFELSLYKKEHRFLSRHYTWLRMQLMLATHVFVLKGAVLTVSVFVWTADLRSVHQSHIVSCKQSMQQFSNQGKKVSCSNKYQNEYHLSQLLFLSPVEKLCLLSNQHRRPKPTRRKLSLKNLGGKTPILPGTLANC